jgi:hypothetical protein
MSRERKITTDHEAIKRWVTERGGNPASVKGSSKEGDAGVLRVSFPGDRSIDQVEPIGWEDFFKKFESNQLAFLYQEVGRDGQLSRFCKLVRRATASVERYAAR